jgi:hypothetical protein
MLDTTEPVEQTATTTREEDSPVFEEGFTPVSTMVIMKKNDRYVAVASKNIKINELVEKCSFMITPYKPNEPDQRTKSLANILPVYPCSCDTCKILGPNIVVPSGNIMFVQFSKTPNLDIKFNTDIGIIECRAISRIHKGDELFINYTELYPKNELDQEAVFKESFHNANV